MLIQTMVFRPLQHVDSSHQDPGVLLERAGLRSEHFRDRELRAYKKSHGRPNFHFRLVL